MGMTCGGSWPGSISARMTTMYSWRETWEEVVHKMVTAYKAPISPDDEKRIVEYLAKTKSVP
jgi:hypothetical protein